MTNDPALPQRLLVPSVSLELDIIKTLGELGVRQRVVSRAVGGRQQAFASPSGRPGIAGLHRGEAPSLGPQ